MELREALLIVADWVDEGLASGALDYYYWGYNDTAPQLRQAAEGIDG